MIRAAILTISDSCSEGTRKDLSGETIINMLPGDKFQVCQKMIVPDDYQKIVKELISCSDNEDIDIVCRTHSHVCLCPRSNYNLGVGLPPVIKFLQKGIPLCLGTDSLASNSDLSLWQEMLLIKKFFPSISGAQILKMATLSGALALGKLDFGSIEVGKRTPLLFVSLNNIYAKDIEDTLIFEGQGRGVEWIL